MSPSSRLELPGIPSVQSNPDNIYASMNLSPPSPGYSNLRADWSVEGATNIDCSAVSTSPAVHVHEGASTSPPLHTTKPYAVETLDCGRSVGEGSQSSLVHCNAYNKVDNVERATNWIYCDSLGTAGIVDESSETCLPNQNHVNRSDPSGRDAAS